jgi:hypothetical protein
MSTSRHTPFVNYYGDQKSFIVEVTDGRGDKETLYIYGKDKDDAYRNFLADVEKSDKSSSSAGSTFARLLRSPGVKVNIYAEKLKPGGMRSGRRGSLVLHDPRHLHSTDHGGSVDFKVGRQPWKAVLFNYKHGPTTGHRIELYKVTMSGPSRGLEIHKGYLDASTTGSLREEASAAIRSAMDRMPRWLRIKWHGAMRAAGERSSWR